MTDLLATSDALLEGRSDVAGHNPFAVSNELAEVTDGVAFVDSFANVAAFATDDGLCLVDTGSPFTASTIHEAVAAWWPPPRLATAIYTHGHIDHVFGTAPYEEQARAEGWPAPEVVAQAAVSHRFDRYQLTAGYNGCVNQRQFQNPKLRWPTDYRYPDRTYDDRLDLEVGGTTFELHHARGETDDHTWVWVPERRVLCSGDLIIWCAPNAGNPQKAQRYPRDWAAALRTMADLGAEVLLPGHGLPVLGADKVAMVLGDTAALLEHLCEETLAMMNRGARLDEILGEVRAPAELVAKPYLRPIYDDPEFIIHNIWRLYGGWYDGNPAHLQPAREADLASEVADLAGGADRLAARATELADAGDLRLAGHLAELATAADPTSAAGHRARAVVNRARADAEPSLMAKGIYTWAATVSEGELEDPHPE